MTSIRDLIDAWPKRQAFAADLSAALKEPIAVDRVHKWARNGAIPARFHSAVLMVAALREVPITAQQLIDLHAPTPAHSEDAA